MSADLAASSLPPELIIEPKLAELQITLRWMKSFRANRQIQSREDEIDRHVAQRH